MPQTVSDNPQHDTQQPDADEAQSPTDTTLLTVEIEAILLSNSKPIPASRIADVINATADGEIDSAMIETAIETLNEVYSQTGRSFRIEPVAGGYRVMTRPEHAGILAAFHRKQASSRLSRPAIETLAIVAYKQPMTRAKLEAIRGVGCGEVLRSLLERKLIAVTGRAEELGRPMLYGTTKFFLDSFGIRSVKDLPSVEAMVESQNAPG